MLTAKLFIQVFEIDIFICPISTNKIITNLHKYWPFLKNVAVAYIGIFVGGDYLFSWINFLGLSIWWEFIFTFKFFYSF